MNEPLPATAPRSRKKLIVTVIAIALIACYIASPYFSFWRFSIALRDGDSQAVGSHVDFPELRASLKKEFRERFYPALKLEKPKKKDRLQQFLQGIGPSLIDTAIDAYLTPDGIALLLANPKISATTNPAKLGEATTTEKAEQARRSIDWSKVRYAFFTGVRDFLVDVNGTKLRFRLSLDGWRLRAIDLPDDFVTR